MIQAILILLLHSCKPGYPDCPATFLNKTDDRLTIVNNASKMITFSLSHDYPKDSSSLELLVPSNQAIDANPQKNIAPNSAERYVSRSCWEFRFKNYIPSGTVRILIFETDSLKALSATEIINRGLYKSYLYTLDELKGINWRVTYP